MNLLDKLVVLNKMLEAHASVDLDFSRDVQLNREVFTDSKKFFRNTEKFDNVLAELDQLETQKSKFDIAAKNAVSEINSMLRKLEVNMMQRDYEKHNTIPVSVEDTARRMEVNEDFFEHINTQIGKYSDWRWAGIDMNPGHGKFTHQMLACDPFYVYDNDNTDIEKVKNKFNDFFSERRLMAYSDVETLPINSIGLAINICEFEFLPMDPIKDKLRTVFNILMPGGHFIFTYNDCEKRQSLEQCAYDYRSYNTKTLMESLAYSIGFDIEQSNCINDIDSYMVVKKPGNINSIKLSAPLVSIDKK